MKLLITGATGLIGTQLCQLCRDKGIAVNFLSRSREKIDRREYGTGFLWNPKTGEIDGDCLEDVDKIIHLAGASVAKRWTNAQRKAIMNSRINSAGLLFDLLSKKENHITQFISASAVGIYPDSWSQLYDEDSEQKDDGFLGHVVEEWEKAADQFKELGIGVTKIRIGLVLAEKGGMLAELEKTVKNYVGSNLGSGDQWQSWIHIEDLARLFLFTAENEVGGIFNAVAPHPVKHKYLMKAVANQLDRPLILPSVPEFALKTLLGDMASMITGSQLIQSKRLDSAGFEFKYPRLENALKDLL